MMSEALDHRTLYRLPWSLPDNAIAWLEPTAKCNLACEGCYRANVNQHKSLDEVATELDVFERYRAADGVSIAGGDPLCH
ncbi:MAG: 4Fe-4S cluster-binding domain-containing protein, partial [Gemmatimonadales bacterium]|nr:4Fe-4S cluster-binding domain-containing protein [Gemmatimonadales bacterium]